MCLRVKNLATLVGLVVVAGCSEPGGGGEASSQSHAIERAHQETELSVEENRVRMLENRAARHDWTYAEAEMDQEATEAVGDAATRLEEARPGSLVGSVIPDIPGEHPLLYVKGPADLLVQRIVAEAKVPIRVVDNQPYSLVELRERKDAVHAAIRASGNPQISSWFDFRNPEQIRVKVGRDDESDLPEIDALYSLVPESMREVTSIEVVDRKVVNREWIGGGLRIRDSNVSKCTTGWSMERWAPTGWQPIGVTTARHCEVGNDLDSVAHNSNIYSSVPSLFWHDGYWGDVQIHYPDAPIKPRFYTGTASWSTVTAVEAPTAFSVGEEVCIYSKQRAQELCADIEIVFASCDQGSVQIEMDADVSIPGDSGASWYQVNKAFGGHVGDCEAEDNWSDFTPATYFDEAMDPNVRVLL